VFPIPCQVMGFENYHKLPASLQQLLGSKQRQAGEQQGDEASTSSRVQVRLWAHRGKTGGRCACGCASIACAPGITRAPAYRWHGWCLECRGHAQLTRWLPRSRACRASGPARFAFAQHARRYNILCQPLHTLTGGSSHARVQA